MYVIVLMGDNVLDIKPTKDSGKNH